MARMVINPADFGRVKKMSFKELNDYIYNLYAQGRRDVKEDLFKIEWMTEDEFFDICNALYDDLEGKKI